MKALFDKENRKIAKDALWDNNPITLQVLGICSALAVTVQLKTTLVMCVALTTVLTFSNLIVSLLRNMIPPKIRIIVELSVISSLVVLADQFLQAFLFDMSKQLSVFVGLIITNCIVMGRAEAFAIQNPPLRSIWDGITNGLGYSIVLILVASCREIFGSETLLGHQVIPQMLYGMGYTNCGLMVLAPGAFFILGIIIWIQRYFSQHKEVE